MKKKYRLKNKIRFLIFIFVILLTGFTLFFASSVYGIREVSYRSIQVIHGDSLWTIAQKFQQGGDIRKFIYDIKKLNKIADNRIFEGQLLKIPQNR